MSRLRRLRHAGEYLALRLGAGLVAALPVGTASALGGRIGRVVGPRTGKHRQVLRHLEIGLGRDATEAERARIATDMWEGLGRIFVETLMLDRIVGNASRFDLAPEVEALRAAPDRDNAVFVSAHYGNWEVAVSLLNRLGYRPAGVYRHLNNPRVERYLRRIREPLYPGGLLRKDNVSLLQLIAMVRAGTPVGILCDQREERGITASFLGTPAPTMAVPAAVALRLGVPLIAVRVVRLPGARFRFEGRAIEFEPSGAFADDVRVVTERINAVFSGWIREHPEQWMWTHRRWGRIKMASD